MSPFLDKSASADEERKVFVEKLAAVCAVPDDAVDGGEYLKRLFVDERAPLFPAGKLVRADLAKGVFAALPDGYCVGGEDGLMLFEFLSRFPHGVGLSERLYDYRVGDGVSTSKILTAAQRARWRVSGDFCAQALARSHAPRVTDAVTKGVWFCLVERPWKIGGAETPLSMWMRLSRWRARNCFFAHCGGKS